MPILTIFRTPISYFSEAFTNARRDLGGIFGEDFSRPLQQPVEKPDLFAASSSSAESYAMACYGNDPDCKSDDDDETEGSALPGQQPSKPELVRFSSLPTDVMACYGNDPDCKSDDDDETEGSALPGQQPSKPELVAHFSSLQARAGSFLASAAQLFQSMVSSPQMALAQIEAGN